jgi:Trypsin-co-occurring domain 1
MADDGDTSDSRVPEILVEVRPKSMSGDLGRGLAMLEEFGRRAGEVADSVAEVADQFRSRLQKTLRKPDDHGWHTDSIELRFDIAVQAEAGVVIARAASGATFSAKLTLRAPASPR